MRKKLDLTAWLPNDILVDILSRLPVKSLCRCKAVSRRWHSLIFNDDNRRKLSRTLPGILYSSSDPGRFPREARHFVHVWEGEDRCPLVRPSLSFFPDYCEDITVLDCCNGILLCRFSRSSLHDEFRYVVCNPVEESIMTVLPDSGCGGAKRRVARLAFDPAFAPVTYYVFEFVENDVTHRLVGANIYSSVTGAWDYKESGWDPHVSLRSCRHAARCVLFNGFLHLVSCCSGSDEVLVVDMEGDTWRTILSPADAFLRSCFLGFIGIYKEHLCYINEVRGSKDLSIWILEDYTKDDWANKHRLRLDMLCAKELSPYKCSDCFVIGILQDCNSIIYLARRTLMAYDIDGEEAHALLKLERGSRPPFFLYVPFYTE